MLPLHVALVPETSELSIDELHQVCSAISVQVTRDLGPIWSFDASVDPFTSRAQVPAGYWIVSIQPSDSMQDGGFHTDADNQPSAFVRYGDGWAQRASHEVLEMLVDPSGNRKVAGPHPDGSGKTVEFLVEVADPCEQSTYDVNGTSVSDFFTPRYFDPLPTAGVQYSFAGSITAPRQVLPGGYLSWQDPTDKTWWQLQNLTGDPQIVQVDAGDLQNMALREYIDKAVRVARARPSKRKTRALKKRTASS
jgi:hypothetical protein